MSSVFLLGVSRIPITKAIFGMSLPTASVLNLPKSYNIQPTVSPQHWAGNVEPMENDRPFVTAPLVMDETVGETNTNMVSLPTKYEPSEPDPVLSRLSPDMYISAVESMAGTGPPTAEVQIQAAQSAEHSIVGKDIQSNVGMSPVVRMEVCF